MLWCQESWWRGILYVSSLSSYTKQTTTAHMKKRAIHGADDLLDVRNIFYIFILYFIFYRQIAIHKYIY